MLDRAVRLGRYVWERLVPRDGRCRRCGFTHTGECWIDPCPECGGIHTGDPIALALAGCSGGRGPIRPEALRVVLAHYRDRAQQAARECEANGGLRRATFLYGVSQRMRESLELLDALERVDDP